MINKGGLFVGQSNCNGKAPTGDLPSSITDLHVPTRIFSGSPTFRCLSDTTNRYGAQVAWHSYEFYLKNLTSHWSEDIYLLKLGKDGSNLSTTSGTSTGSWHPTITGEHYDELIAAIDSASAWMSARGKQWKVEFIVWHQGESDCLTLSDANAYGANELALINAIVAHLGYTPYVYIVDIHASLGRPYQAQVSSGKAATVASNSKYRLINQDDCTMSDGTHLDTLGNETLGNRTVDIIKLDIPV